MPACPPTLSPSSRVGGFALVLGTAIAMALWTWNTWPDVLVDFGKELYIAWRLSAGDHLYKDVAYYMGPLSPALNGLLFSMFGVSLRTLVVANLCVAAAVTALLAHLADAVAGGAAAIIAALVFVLLFAFTQYTPTGNYNFVCPYEHEYTHGMLMSLATLAALRLAMTTSKRRWFFLAGFGCGGVALTRAELLIAVGGAVGVGTLLGRPGRSEWVSLSAGFVLPLVVAVGLLGLHVPLRGALLGVAGSWPSIFNRSLTSLPFYRQGMGLDDPARSVRLLLLGTAEWAGWLAPAVLAAVRVTRADRPGLKRSLVIAAFAVYALATAGAWHTVASTGFFRPLAVCTVICVGLASGSWWKQPSTASAFRLSVVAFAALLLLKMALYARIHQYGFAVAMPMTVTTAVALGVVLPRKLDAAGYCGAMLRGAMLGVFVVVIAVYLSLTSAELRRKTVSVGTGADAFWADSLRGPAVNDCLITLSKTTPTRTVLVVPEGAMLNYLARRAEPTPYANFNPPDLAIFGQDNVLAALKAVPPDVVVVAHKDTSEFGVRYFGRDYGQAIGRWLNADYHTARTIGSIPFRDKTRFGISVLEPDRGPQ